EAALDVERTDLEQRSGEAGDGPGGARLSTEPAEVRGELSALRASVEQGMAEQSRTESRLAALEQRAETLAAEAARVRAEMEQAERDEQPLVAALDEAAARRSNAEAAVAAAESDVRRAEADHQTWSARAEALALALDEARARAGAERLADIAGVVGTLLELVEVDEGWEAAFEAAAGEAVAAVVVDGVDSARVALGRLREAGATGAVLPSELA